MVAVVVVGATARVVGTVVVTVVGAGVEGGLVDVGAEAELQAPTTSSNGIRRRTLGVYGRLWSDLLHVGGCQSLRCWVVNQERYGSVQVDESAGRELILSTFDDSGQDVGFCDSRYQDDDPSG